MIRIFKRIYYDPIIALVWYTVIFIEVVRWASGALLRRQERKQTPTGTDTYAPRWQKRSNGGS